MVNINLPTLMSMGGFVLQYHSKTTHFHVLECIHSVAVSYFYDLITSCVLHIYHFILIFSECIYIEFYNYSIHLKIYQCAFIHDNLICRKVQSCLQGNNYILVKVKLCLLISLVFQFVSCLSIGWSISLRKFFGFQFNLCQEFEESRLY